MTEKKAKNQAAVVNVETEDERAAKRYQDVLFRRESLRREAHGYYHAYMKEFGKLTAEVYQAEIACIARKKKIRFAQMAANQGRPVDRASMEFFVEREMTAYREKLRMMREQTELSQKGRELSQLEMREIRSMYRRLAKQIHPDLHPQFAEEAEVGELWQRIQEAYQDNSLKRLQELDVLVSVYLKERKLPAELPKIDYAAKTQELKKEIDRILTTRPYLYRRDLANTEAMENKREELMKQLKEYQDYAIELDAVLAQFEYAEAEASVGGESNDKAGGDTRMPGGPASGVLS